MTQLDERTRGDLARLRARAAPSEPAKQRMFAALEATLGEPEGGDEPDGEPEGGEDPGEWGDGLDLGAASPGALGYAAKVVGATLALTGAGLLVVAIGARLVAVNAGDPSPSSRASQSSAPTQDLSLAAAPERADDGAAAIDPIADESLVGAAPIQRPRPTRQPSPTQTDTLAEELALLEAAHAARDPATALAQLERHLARFPQGSMAAERERLRVEVLCRLGRLDDARVVADRLLREHASAASPASLSAACPELGAQKN